jgi:hypothetical protein
MSTYRSNTDQTTANTMSITLLQDDDDQTFDEDASSWAESIMLPIARNGPCPPHDIQLCTNDLQHQQQHGPTETVPVGPAAPPLPVSHTNAFLTAILSAILPETKTCGKSDLTHPKQAPAISSAVGKPVLQDIVFIPNDYMISASSTTSSDNGDDVDDRDDEDVFHPSIHWKPVVFAVPNDINGILPNVQSRMSPARMTDNDSDHDSDDDCDDAIFDAWTPDVFASSPKDIVVIPDESSRRISSIRTTHIIGDDDGLDGDNEPDVTISLQSEIPHANLNGKGPLHPLIPILPSSAGNRQRSILGGIPMNLEFDADAPPIVPLEESVSLGCLEDASEFRLLHPASWIQFRRKK